MDIVVYILTHNRPDTFIKALKSVECQNYKDFKIVVSDNSSNDETMQLFYSHVHPNNVSYIKRDKEYSSFEHFCICKNEIMADYYMLFHDDDTMLPNCIETLARLAKMHPDCIAIAANAFRVSEKGKVINVYSSQKKDVLINNASFLAQTFLRDNGLPYPSHLYRRDAQNIDFDKSKGGKHCDSCYLTDIAEKAPLYYAYSEIVMKYTISVQQDSHFLEPSHRRSFLKYMMYKAMLTKDSSIVTQFRVNDIYIYYSSNNKTTGLKVLKIFLRYHFNYFLKSVMKNITYKCSFLQYLLKIYRLYVKKDGRV